MKDGEKEDSAEDETKESDDDDDCENWKTVKTKQRSKISHKSSKETDSILNCKICGQYVLTENELRAHMNECHKKQDNCDKCDFQASSKSILIKHMNMKHNNKQHGGEDAFKCDKCSVEFDTNWSMMNHLRDDHGQKKEICKYFRQNRCSFSAKVCWNSHGEQSRTMHSVSSDTNKCFSCHMVFSTKNGMMRHKKIKHIEEVKECL